MERTNEKYNPNVDSQPERVKRNASKPVSLRHEEASFWSGVMMDLARNPRIVSRVPRGKMNDAKLNDDIGQLLQDPIFMAKYPEIGFDIAKMNEAFPPGLVYQVLLVMKLQEKREVISMAKEGRNLRR
jgi:hypothetical protein